MAKPPTRQLRPRLIDDKRRVALPPEVMRALDVEAGGDVAFEIKGGRVRLRKARRPVK